jgi:hypothetical protein
MRRYFELCYSARPADAQNVVNYEMGNFDLTVFWTGKRFVGRIPKSIRIWVDSGKPTDYLANPISWTIISESMWDVVKSFVKDEAQVLTVPLFCADTNEPVRGYKLLNSLRCVSVVKKKLDVFQMGMKIDLGRIPDDAHLFRILESPTSIMVSNELRNALKKAKLQSIGYIKTYPCS